MRKQLLYILLCGWMAVTATSCSFLEVEPEGVILAENALQTPRDLQLLLNSCYEVLGSDKLMGGRYQFLAELMGDNLDGRVLSGNWLSYFNRNTTIFNDESRDTWQEVGFLVYRCNTLLENVDLVEGVTADERTRIVAEAQFLRAVGFFELSRLYSLQPGFTADNSHPGVVLRLATGIDPQPRNTVAETYAQIIDDMKAAETSIPAINPGYANVWAVKGYLAKVYFQQNDFQNAFDYANDVISNGGFQLSTDIMSRFSQTQSPENIFTLASTGTLDNAGAYFQTAFRSDGVNEPGGRINPATYTIASSEADDLRGQNWYLVTNQGEPNELVFTTRFNDINWFSVPLVHLAELMLIRAECAAELGDLTTATDDLNAIRTRAGLAATTATGATDLIQAIRDERRLELICEGARVHDLKRQGALGENITINGAPWNCPGLAVQLPDEELAGNPDIELNGEGGCN